MMAVNGLYFNIVNFENYEDTTKKYVDVMDTSEDDINIC